MVKKKFFGQATKSEIKEKDLVTVNSYEDISNLKHYQFAILNSFVPRGYESARKFMKHGREVRLKRFYSIDHVVKEGRVPVQLRRESFNAVKEANYCGYTFLPLGKDKRKRKVSLVECLEGARIFAYSYQVPGTRINVKSYASSKKVRVDGAEVVCEVPSRRKGERRIQLKLMSVPMVDSMEKYGIALNIVSDHSCGAKRFNIRYRYTDDKESSGIVNVCAHEIAGYLELIQQEWREGNIIPLQMNQFAIPTQKTVDYYLKWENNILVRDEDLVCGDKLRKPNRAEKEMGLWGLVNHFGHDETFYSRKSRDGGVCDYRWKS